MNAFEKIKEGLEEALDIASHRYWLVGVFKTERGRQYSKRLHSGNDLSEVERLADEFSLCSDLTIKPTSVYIRDLHKHGL